MKKYQSLVPEDTLFWIGSEKTEGFTVGEVILHYEESSRPQPSCSCDEHKIIKYSYTGL